MGKLYTRLLTLTIAISLVVLFVFSAVSYSKSKAEYLWNKTNITIVDTLDYEFVSIDYIKQTLGRFKYKLNKTKLNTIQTNEIKKSISKNGYIDHAWVYCGMDGSLNIVVSQFNPVLLLKTSQRLYMLNQEGESRIVNGSVMKKLPYITTDSDSANLSRYFKNSLIKDILPEDITKIICKFASDLYDDKLLGNLIVQIHINSVGEVELIPRFGARIITFCDLSDIERYDTYASKLKSFYETIAERDDMETYSKVNLKFKNQIVATKK